MLKQGIETLQDIEKVLSAGNSSFYREEREKGAVETKVITIGKIVPYKCCLPSSDSSVKTDFNTDILFDQRHTFSGTFCIVY